MAPNSGRSRSVASLPIAVRLLLFRPLPRLVGRQALSTSVEAYSAPVGHASNPVIIALHLRAVAGLPTIDRCSACSSGFITSTPVVARLRRSPPDHSTCNTNVLGGIPYRIPPFRRRGYRSYARNCAQYCGASENGCSG
jgi:hypothetical protein